MTDFILKILDLFRGFFRLLGVDYRKLRILLWVKLTVDNRQEKSIAQRKGKKEMSNSLGLVALVYAFMGLFVGIILIQMRDIFSAMVFVFSMVMVMTAVALISDFTSVLLDTTDNAILLPRPVDSRTLAVARITHIILYILLITLALTAASIVIGTVKFGPLYTIVFFIALFFAVLFVVFLANVFYLLLMKISTEEHFRDVILYFQIFMAAFAMGSYQLLPRLMEVDALKGFTLPIRWWTYLLPPAWMAAPIDIAATGSVSGPKIAMTVCGLILPIVSIIVVIRFLAPGFSRALIQMDTAASPANDKVFIDTDKRRNLATFLSRIFTSSPAERAVFQLSWKLSSRDRKFKLRTYPTFGYMLIIAFVLSVYREGKILENIQKLPLTEKHLIFLYIGCILIPIVVLAQRFSDQFEASWIYRTLPFVSPGDIQKGSLKAMVIKYGVSVFVPLAIFVILVWGPRVMDDIVLAFSNMMITSLVIGLMVRSDLPFSRSYTAAAERQRGLTGVILFIVPASIGGIHFGLTLIPYAVPIAIVFSLAIAYTAMKIYGSTSWDRITLL
jgi:ABC-2 type transport system permease protein